MAGGGQWGRWTQRQAGVNASRAKVETDKLRAIEAPRQALKPDKGLIRRSSALIIENMATAPDPKPVPRALIEKIGMLSRARQSEVEDFVDFIAMRDGASANSELELSRMVAAASSPAFAAIWDNPEDDIYDAL